MRASRSKLPPEPPSAHAGLALQRYLLEHDDQKVASRKLLEVIVKTEVAAVYKAAFARWKEALGQPATVFLEATTRTPLAIGLGNTSPIENGLAIHHTYGTPYLPGSALKGLLRRVADHYELSPAEKAMLFGESPDARGKKQGSAAHLVYWDGWLDPVSVRPYQKDVITVHHPDYYGKRGVVWPTDFDDPNPVSFLSVKPGTKFCLALSSLSQNATDWLYLATQMLGWGLENLGLGGKTNAGYGYFEVKLPPRPRSEHEQGLELLESYRVRIGRIKPGNERQELEFFIRELEGKPLAVRKPVLEAIRQQLVQYRVWNPASPQHARIQELLEGP